MILLLKLKTLFQKTQNHLNLLVIYKLVNLSLAFFEYNDDDDIIMDYKQNYPTILKSKKINDRLGNLLKNPDPLLKYIMFRIKPSDSCCQFTTYYANVI